MDKLEFNTTGPCDPARHYLLPTKDRLVGAELDRYVQRQLYWVLHAPRQVGKTTFLQSWAKELNESGEVVACYVSVERAQALPDIEQAMPAIVTSLAEYATAAQLAYIPEYIESNAPSLLSVALANWAKKVGPKPLVVLFDEVDVLEGPALISFLRQLRGGFATRAVGIFPISVALVGMRDLKDYLVTTKDGVALNPGSPFNIKEDSITLENFSEDDVFSLLAQHTSETGQVFEADAARQLFHYTQGQPWLVNALAKECVVRLEKDRSKTITAEHIEIAKEKLIKSRAVHIDSLAERLKDPRVKRVIEPVLAGAMDPELSVGESFRLCLDLGLVTKIKGVISIANPIYREVLIRTLNIGQQDALPEPEFRWQKADGDLDMDALMTEFQKFWRRHGDIWEQKADYTEVFPQLLLMAFFQRVLNGGARLERECATGRGRMDMAIFWKDWRHIIEIKLVNPHDSRETTREEGLVQIKKYADTIDPHTQLLVIFDRTESGRKMPWDERLIREEEGDVVIWWN